MYLLSPSHRRHSAFHCSGASRDTPRLHRRAILLFVVADRLYALLATHPRGEKEAAYEVFSITTIAAVAVTIKVSAIFFALLAAAVALGVWLYRRSASNKTLRRTLTWTLGAGLLIGGSWMARSVVLSGYPLFPSRVAGAAVDWRTSAEHADAEYALAAHSSKASTILYEVVAGRDRWGYLPHQRECTSLRLQALVQAPCAAKARAI